MNVDCVFQTYNGFTYANFLCSLFPLLGETSDDNDCLPWFVPAFERGQYDYNDL